MTTNLSTTQSECYFTYKGLSSNLPDSIKFHHFTAAKCGLVRGCQYKVSKMDEQTGTVELEQYPGVLFPIVIFEK